MFRYELRSAEQLDAIAGAPLPLRITASPPHRTRHRDLFLDTPDETLRSQGIFCRLRIGADDRHVLSLRIDGSNGTPPLRIDAASGAADVQGALAENTTAARRIRALIDPARLVPLLDLEVDRISRLAHPDFFRRPRLELHFDRITIRRDDAVRTFHQLCAHLRRGPAAGLVRLAGALEAAYDLRQPSARPREHAELLLRWKRMAPHRAPLEDSDQAMRAVSDGTAAVAPYLNP